MKFRLEPEESTIRALLDGDADILALSSMFHQSLLKSTDRSIDSKLSCEGRVSFGSSKRREELVLFQLFQVPVPVLSSLRLK